MRIAMGVEYDGSRYLGWQRQRQGATVQAELETALSRIADEPVEVVCAGRTDTGVHALGQVVHFESNARRNPRGWLLGTNSALPADISISWVREVSPEFHARFHATSRRYLYLILNRPVRSAFADRRAFVVIQPLDILAMQSAAVHLRGEHDFSAFRAAGCQAKSPQREITDLEIRRLDDWVTIDIRANAFLQHMVRNIAGLLVGVGRGDLAPSAALTIRRSLDRKTAPFAAPAAGLTLISVDYPQVLGLPVAAPRSLPLPTKFFD